MALKEAQHWIDMQYKAGAKRIGVSCNPIKREIYIMADFTFNIGRITIKGPTQRETRIMKDILHDYVAALPKQDANR